MKKYFKYLYSFIILLTAPVFAADTVWGNLLDKINSDPNGPNAFTKEDIAVLAVNVVNVALGFVALIAAIFIIISGYQYIASAGNADATSKATKNLTNSVTGLVLAALSYMISNTVVTKLGGSVNNGKIDNFDPIKNITIGAAITKVLGSLVGFGALFAGLFIVISGVLFLTAAGDPDRLNRAKKGLTFSIVGLVVMILSWVIIRFVGTAIGVTF